MSWMTGIQVCSNEGPCPFPFPREIITKLRKYMGEIQESFWPISAEFGTKCPWMKGTQGFTNNGHSILKNEVMGFPFLINIMISS